MSNLNGKTVGQILREKRELKGISLEEASRSTRIKQNYLQELENDHPEMFSSSVQARGFLRLYASYLHLAYDPLIAIWDNPSYQEPQGQGGEPDEFSTGESQSTDQSGPESIRPEEENAQRETGASVEPDPDVSQETPVENAPKMKGLTAFFGKVSSSWQHTKNLVFDSRAGQKFKSFFEKKAQTGEKIAESEKAGITHPQKSSKEIFRDIGTIIGAQRERMELTLSDIEKFTNIKRMYLVAIEDGRFSDLPSTVQGRGMLNIYAHFLALDESDVMDRFAAGLQLQREESLAPQRKPSQPPVTIGLNLPPGMRKILNPDLIIGGLFIIGLFGFILWGTTQMLGGERTSPTEAPSISEVLQITPTLSPTPQSTQLAEGTDSADNQEATNGDKPAGVEVVPAQPTPIATINAAPLQLYIIAHDRAFMKISVDNVELFNGRVIPNNVYTYSGQNQIELLTGNGAALEVYFNQEYLGELGRLGEVVQLSFSADGLSAPTPTPAEEMEDNMQED